MNIFRRRTTLTIHDLLISTRLGQKQFFSIFPCRTNFHSRPQTAAGNKEYSNQDFLFQYTSGRWLWGEKEQLAARYVKFDVAALCQAAADAVGSRSCTDITILTEGNFNKVMLLTMNDGKEVIAKIPNPNAGHPHFVTSSEVATMEFVSIYYST